MENSRTSMIFKRTKGVLVERWLKVERFNLEIVFKEI